MKTSTEEGCVRAPIAAPAGIREHAALLRALADEARLEIVGRLAAAGGPVCVCDLTPGLGLSQPTVSHHLKVLRDAGVVRSERRGTWVHYALELSVIGSLGQLIGQLAPPRVAAAPCTESCAPKKAS